MPSLDDLHAAADLVHRHMPPTPQYCWPLLSQRLGTELWVKHENHTPIGAFKVRGGLVYLNDLRRRSPDTPGVLSPTRGNHGQSLAYAARALGLTATVVVPHGNSVEKNASMRALGAEVIEHGHDFQAAREFAEALAQERGLHMVPPFHRMLVRGVASYWLELLEARPDLDVLYVPIGMGSGISAAIAVRDALGLATRIVGVVAEEAAAYALSFRKKAPAATETAETMADGLACRTPDAEAVAVILGGAEDVVTVSEEEIKAAMRAYFTDTHNLAEGAGAAPLAAALKQREQLAGRRVGAVLSGGNVDLAVFREVLAAG